MDKDKLLSEVINVRGALSQCDMMVEECSELIQAIQKLKRLGGITKEGIRKPGKDDTIAYCLAYNNVCSELVDVRILTRQLSVMLRSDQLDLIEERKLDRLKKRIETDLWN